MVQCASAGNPDIKGFDTSCFDKKYITGDVSEHYLETLEIERNDGAKTLRVVNGTVDVDTDESDLEVVA